MYLRMFSILCGVLLHAAAASAGEPPRSARIVTSSDDLQLSKSDHTIGLKRTTKPQRRTIVILPPDAEPDQEFVVDDLACNFNRMPVTVTAPDHQAIFEKRTFVLNGDCGSVAFRYFGNGTWGAEQ